MSYEQNGPSGQREEYGPWGSEAFGGGSLTHQIVGPKGCTGWVRDIMVELTAAAVGTTTVPEIMVGISHWNPVARRQGRKLAATTREECVASNEEGVRTFARKCRKSRIDLAECRGIEHLDLQPHGRGGFLHAAQCGIGNRRVGRIDEHRNTKSCGDQVLQEPQAFGYHLGDEKSRSRCRWAGQGW